MGNTSKEPLWVSWLLLICAVFYLITQIIKGSIGLGAIVMFLILIYSVVSLVKFYKNRKEI